MVTTRTARMMTRYNAWSNKVWFDAIAALPPGEATKERKGLFKNMVHTLNHYLPFLTMSSDSGERSVSFDESWSQSRSAQAITRHSLLYLQTIEKAEELVSRFVAPWLAVLWGCLRKSLLLHCERCIEIDLRGLHRLMSEPQCDHRTFSACL